MFFQNSTLRLVVLALLSCRFCYATHSKSYSGNYSITQIEVLPVPKNQENIAVRHTGDLLVTSTTSSSLFQVSTSKNASKPLLITNIRNATAITGIAELEPDVFYIATSNLTGVTATPGSNDIWKVDLRSCSPSQGEKGRSQKVITSHIARIPTAQLINGLTRLAQNDSSTLLFSDSGAGLIMKLNVRTGVSEIIARDPTMANTQNGLQVAVNGIKTHGPNLFFTNLNQGLFARLPISLQSGKPTGPVDVIFTGGAQGDDFAISANGRKAWIAVNGHNTLVEVDVEAKTNKVVLNSTLLAADSSAAFGRTKFDRTSLYVTGEAVIASENGTTEGQVVRVDLPYSYADLYL